MTKHRLCSIDGCGKAALARGWCDAHYRRWRKHGSPLAGGTPDGAPMAFLEAALVSEGDDCVIWPFSRNWSGYGQIRADGKKHLAHRVVCARAHGEPPTPKHHAAHSCGKGHLGCVNHRHLSWKTCSENHADKLIHGTDSRGEKSGVAKLTEADVREIRRMRRTATRQALAETFDVSPQAIGNIQRRQSWAWLGDNP